MSTSFEDLEVWQIGKNIVMEVYQLTTHFPKEESFVLTSQIRRAALSVPANIAEGFGRYHYLDKAKFYLNARGSLYELKSHLLIVQELDYLSQSQPVSSSLNEPQTITSLVNTIDKLGLKLNNLISNTRKLHKESQ
ncbi:MAG: four helix bundle protein [Chloroflexi bacterium]|nr:four helix bundle protein [Chloroflexota bacterium]